MIQANELRIGNLFDHFEDGILPIEEIKKDSDGFKGYYAVFRNGSSKSIIGILSPIPLTEEWLLKFGFIESSETQYGGWLSPFIDGEAIRLRIDGAGSYYYTSSKYSKPLHIWHIHTLQNLYFALTGQELQIK